VTDAKTAKNRAKRLKRKAGRKGGDGDDKEKGPAKSKFAAGAGGTATAGSGSKFAHPNHQEPANDDQTARTAGIASTPKFSIPASAQEQQALRDEGVASAEVQISIVDDD
jgi:hypothetical protein